MYPLHKYVPTPFGTYLMYINHGKERIKVEHFPKDVDSLKKEIAQHSLKQVKNPANQRQRKQKETVKNEDMDLVPSSKHLNVPPSYRIRLLEHTGQTITEPPSNVIIVDDITGADVTSSITWIRNRPQRWQERVKLHEIENPKMTSTLKKAPTYQPRRINYPAAERLLDAKISVPEAKQREVVAPHPRKDPEPQKAPLLPHITKQRHPNRGREKREERDREARKRRRKVDKIMELVVNRTRIARLNAGPDNYQVPDLKHSKYRDDAMMDHRRSLSVDLEREKRKNDEILRSSSELSNAQLRSRPTIHEEIKPPRIQDWNPRKDQQMVNHIILERMEAAMPYKWKSEIDETSNLTPEQPPPTHQYRFVL